LSRLDCALFSLLDWPGRSSSPGREGRWQPCRLPLKWHRSRALDVGQRNPLVGLFIRTWRDIRFVQWPCAHSGAGGRALAAPSASLAARALFSASKIVFCADAAPSRRGSRGKVDDVAAFGSIPAPRLQCADLSQPACASQQIRPGRPSWLRFAAVHSVGVSSQL